MVFYAVLEISPYPSEICNPICVWIPFAGNSWEDICTVISTRRASYTEWLRIFDIIIMIWVGWWASVPYIFCATAGKFFCVPSRLNLSCRSWIARLFSARNPMQRLFCDMGCYWICKLGVIAWGASTLMFILIIQIIFDRLVGRWTKIIKYQSLRILANSLAKLSSQ